MALPTYWLSFHVRYACEHSGSCCSAAWDIEVETSRVAPIAASIASGRLPARVPWLRLVEDAPEGVGGVLALSEGGRCVFHQSPGCAVHAVLGHQAIPSACQHFPRIALIDRRGVFVSLSHYCPTAAALLFDTAPVTIVEGPAVLPDGRLPEGLDAREELPPLESPRRLMDWTQYAEWERRTVAMLTSGAAPDESLDLLDPSTRAISDESLLDRVQRAVPPPYAWRPVSSPAPVDWSGVAPVVGRYLAAHAFASWTAYQGNGLRCTALYLRLVLAVLKGELARERTLLEAVRQSDLVLRHLADRQALADGLSALAVR